MKEFLKIFFVLCAIVSAFFFGRNYGEQTKSESAEFKNLKASNFENQNAQEELKNIKIKFQKIIDNTDLRKTNEVLSQIITIFLADLNLHFSSEKQTQLSEGNKNFLSAQNTKAVLSASVTKDVFRREEELNNKLEEERKRNALRNPAQFKTAEESLLKAESTEEIRRQLKKVEVKKIDSLLDDAPMATYEESQKIFGVYRGSLIDVTNNIYGTVAFDIQANASIENPIKGSIKFYRNGKERGAKIFETNWLGYKGSGSQALIIEFDDNYLQIYKIENSQKIAGIYYDRLPNGTSKTIGVFVLSRMDFAE